MKSEFPLSLNLLAIPSGEDKIVGRMYVAEGEGPHATMLLLHGFPGVMMNQDTAAELQKNGFNIMIINYRGSWGSQGSFSFSTSLEDVHATLRYIKQKEVARKNRIDVNRIALAGHSFGGFLSLIAAVSEPTIQAVAALSSANFSLFAEMLAQDPDLEEQFSQMLNDSCFFLNGASVDGIMEEILLNKKEWNTFLAAPQLVDRKLLVTAAQYDLQLPKQSFFDPLIHSLKQAGANNLQCEVLETDHNYIDKRKELADILLMWLKRVL
ncbi:alpha/beta hydrolase family protein [Falsibacillus pallidus]|uniref:Alpha/beta hydrolase family protein n=1 Tax=Falsibacillus pallidus TaxID=493781 RepID=A0A370G5X6_9BACI|nr:alpha/beta hydrolase [Falsibacillus pallidus]RDI39175.1 alpha/beta hydrolase family protein [Falsibacillus pallidus]